MAATVTCAGQPDGGRAFVWTLLDFGPGRVARRARPAGIFFSQRTAKRFRNGSSPVLDQNQKGPGLKHGCTELHPSAGDNHFYRCRRVFAADGHRR
jgi:hypothetical protein